MDEQMTPSAGKKENFKKKRFFHILLRFIQTIPFLAMLCAIVWYLIYGRHIAVQDILQSTPNNLFLAAAIFILLYLLKSLSIFFPLLVLFIAGGIVFGPLGILVNTLGVSAGLTMNYFIGRYAGLSFLQKILKKYPKMDRASDYIKDKGVFSVFLMRAIPFPADVVSMYLGGIGVPYGKYLSGSLLGMSVVIVSQTLVGNGLSDPTSPLFILSCVVTILLPAASALLYYRLEKQKAEKKKGAITAEASPAPMDNPTD